MQRTVILGITLLHTVLAEFVQIRPGIIPFRHLIMRHLIMTELYLHMTAVGNPLGILHSLPGVREKSLHLLLALHIILSALIAHTVFVGHFLARLQAQQNIMRLRVLRICVMHIVGCHQRDIQLPAHLQKHRIHRLLGRNPMIL